MEVESRSTTRKVIIDVICLACVGFPLLFFYLFGSPYQRGLFCNDESIRYPFKDSTVTSFMLYFIGLVLPICLFLVVEWIHYRSGESHANRKVTFNGRNVHPWVWRCYCVIGVFGFGAACSQLLTDIAKYTIGRLRPHFWSVCQPSIDCSLPQYQNTYIIDFTCKGDNARLIREGRLSFLSGHSSFSAYTMVFLVLYLQCRVYWRGSHLIRHFAQFICISMAWFTALSRVSDYKHHWSDVLAGSLLGTTVAIVVTVFIARNYAQSPTESLTRLLDPSLSTEHRIKYI
ncbi:putative phosphatidate phosphatase isoform X2 [Macrosteles quadrilineatus]|uniref:putative phosphatidate phosphatase isoform X2 n=1 Tax=Macrosteles quadrilineatus TaxID=74068 RepID=UPI0023E1A5CE|nr:putative phosphatidate phosphatase isoform X2 [Macrosteles quadrilineatus]XP_054278118.1 putative phosphatidate phosphatase isoform X2 [Macrosteles quadrilineatus]